MKRLITLLLVPDALAGALALPAAAEEKSIEVWMISNPRSRSSRRLRRRRRLCGRNRRQGQLRAHSRPTTSTRSWSPTSPPMLYPDMVIWNTRRASSSTTPHRRAGGRPCRRGGPRQVYRKRAQDVHHRRRALRESSILMRPPACTCARAGGEGRLRHHAQDRRQRQYYYEGLRTWEDVLELGKKLTDAANGKYGLGFQYSPWALATRLANMWGSSSPTAPR